MLPNVMNLKNKINQIFKTNSGYSDPSHAANQACSLDAISKDLYTDSTRFIYELLQNADDSAIDQHSVNVWIKIIDNNLIFAHSGKPFDERDVQGICNINNGTKKKDITKTGYKGIGFKSVFAQSEKVIIFSSGEYFKFDINFKYDWPWPEPQEEWERKNERPFQYPWQIIPIYMQENEVETSIHDYLNSIHANVATIIALKHKEQIENSLEELSQKTNMFLFLKNISSISFDIKQQVDISINKQNNGKICLFYNKDETDWLVKNFEIIIPEEIKSSLSSESQNIPEKFKEITKLDITLSTGLENESIFKLHKEEKPLYSYLPTNETKYNLPVLVNASFLTTANRESIHTESIWNQWLFKEIGIKLFNWIAELVQSEYQWQAYHLLPDKIYADSLGIEFNKAIDIALETIPFVVARNGKLIKIKDSIIDFTSLSEKPFVGEENIKKQLILKEDYKNKFFVKNTSNGQKFVHWGALSFRWKNVPDLFSSEFFQNNHSVEDNIALIEFFYELNNFDQYNALKTEEIKKTPFIFDHKKTLCVPQKISFPSAGDTQWNNQNTDLSFVHEDIQTWLRKKLGIRTWLENLGVTEKTDTTYIEQIIIPKIKTYITNENAISTIQDLFKLYERGDLQKDVIEKLSELKLLTTKGTLKPANTCHLSDFYDPRLKIENFLDLNIFVSEQYYTKEYDKSTWKSFFKMMGVKGDAAITSYSNKIDIEALIKLGLQQNYFNAEDKYFQPFQSTFHADYFKNITTISYIEHTKNNIKFSIALWKDFIDNNEPSQIETSSTAFWGNGGMPGRTTGNQVQNYIPWYIKNIPCIPTTQGSCSKSSDIFLNTKEIKDIGGNYLPIFEGVELNADWRAFFNFKTKLELTDYLSILNEISLETNENNTSKVYTIYKFLLDGCMNWGEEEIQTVKTWGASNKLLNTDNKFIECKSLKSFIDGNEAIFQEQFSFIDLHPENKQHPSLEQFLGYLGIQILRQSNFNLIPVDVSECSELKNHLINILPYFKIWVKHDKSNIKTLRALENLQLNISQLNINHAIELQIRYEDLDFTKNTNVHLDDEKLYVTKPWNSNSVLMTLPTQLCRFLSLQGQDKKLDFLLRSTIAEIQNYFSQENIHIPEDVLNQYEDELPSNQTITTISGLDDAFTTQRKVPREFLHQSQADLEKKLYAESIISRSVKNIIQHLKSLKGYDCSSHYPIAYSIIGGIKKDGHEITIVARPSDNSEVILFYQSEFDVLSHTDAEFWYEDGKNPPRQMRIGQLITQLEINRLPIRSAQISSNDILTEFTKKSQTLEFDAIPFVPEKLAKIIASFANTDGGKIIFGLKEQSESSSEIVSLSKDFNVIDIVQSAILMLSPIPSISYDYVNVEGKNIFLIKVEKNDDQNILLNNMKYIRNNTISTLEVVDKKRDVLNQPKIEKTFAIIIAIEHYHNKITSVQYARNDAIAFKEMLINNMGVQAENIFIFIDDDALKSTLEYDLKKLFMGLQENDRLVFYYAGHGFHDTITNCLTTFDSHPSSYQNTTISLRDVLLDPLKKSRCKNALIFIDACAQKLVDPNQRHAVSHMNEEEFKLIVSKFPSYNIFLSCQLEESSYSHEELEHGVWTYFLLQALSGNVKQVRKDNFITDRLLQDYLSTSVSQYVKKNLKYDQNPTAIMESNYENVII